MLRQELRFKRGSLSIWVRSFKLVKPQFLLVPVEVLELDKDLVFNVLSRATSRIFLNREVLRPDYIPDELPHREAQIEELAQILSPLLRGERPNNVFIYGLTGTGKTAVTKYVLKKVSEYVVKLSAPKFLYSYVNCRHEDTTYRVLASLASSLGVKVPFTGISTAEVYSRIKRALEDYGGVFIVVLDEVDFLVKRVGDDLLYKLTRINDELVRAKVAVIGITNDIKFMERLDPRVRSSLGEVEIVFPPYDAIQLTDILRDRASKAFRDGVIDDSVIQYCASIAAKEHGDARRALDLLRVAGEIAERSGCGSVTVEHVRKARVKIERDMVTEVIRTMPYHGKVVLLTIALAGGKFNSTGELYIRYRELCEVLRTEAVTQRRISDIVSELEMLGIISARIVSRGRYGKTRYIVLSVEPSTVLNALAGEPRLGWIVKNAGDR
ncbi:MAG: cell division control protein Cdc6 [Desulfurococcales archaeon ex4484_204]|nr:MAG: cell division control protein Cdc6 [Desulfurococcales archaeon ex4484_204]